MLRKLRGTLNVVYLEDVFEDDKNVYIVMELCRGGELLQKINNRHYSERTVRDPAPTLRQPTQSQASPPGLARLAGRCAGARGCCAGG